MQSWHGAHNEVPSWHNDAICKIAHQEDQYRDPKFEVHVARQIVISVQKLLSLAVYGYITVLDFAALKTTDPFLLIYPKPRKATNRRVLRASTVSRVAALLFQSPSRLDSSVSTSLAILRRRQLLYHLAPTRPEALPWECMHV